MCWQATLCIEMKSTRASEALSLQSIMCTYTSRLDKFQEEMNEADSDSLWGKSRPHQRAS